MDRLRVPSGGPFKLISMYECIHRTQKSGVGVRVWWRGGRGGGGGVCGLSDRPH